MKFTASQQAAITRLGQDVCVIAGPGSGKTRVLTERFAWLVEKQGVAPQGILAITFTEKAATEIRRRVQKRLPHPEVRQAPISTLHAFCLRILKEFAIPAGLDPGVALWDERVSSAQLYAAVEEVLNEAAVQEQDALRRLFTTWSVADPSQELSGLYKKIWALTDRIPSAAPLPSAAAVLFRLQDLGRDLAGAAASTDASRAFLQKFRDWFADFRAEADWRTYTHLETCPKRGTLPKALKEIADPFYSLAEDGKPILVSALTQHEKSFLLLLIDRIAANYAARKRAAARMDFQDVEHETIRLLTSSSDIQRVLQNRYEHILMDEMQDTNPVQWKLLNLLRTPGGFFAVGDINQSIYRFRYAAPQLFRDYRAEIETQGLTVDRLQENFRSRSEILHFTELVLGDEPGMEKPNLLAGRRFQTANPAVQMAGFSELSEELAWLSQEIPALLERFTVEDKDSGQLRRARYSDMAVLVRKSNTGEQVSAALAQAGIPASLTGGRAFFEKQEVIDLLQYLAYLANPLDQLAAATVLRSPLVGMSDEQLRQGWVDQAFAHFYRQQRADLDFVAPDLLLARALDRSGYLENLDSAAQANVAKLLDIVRGIWAEAPRTMRAFVDELAAMRAASQEKSATPAEAEDAVSVLTVHAAKGLEFPIVFVVAAGARASTSKESLHFHHNLGVGVKWRNPWTGKLVADREQSAIAELAKAEEGEEDRRLFYVALTRAEQKVYVSWASDKNSGWLKYLKAHKDAVFPGLEEDPPPAEALPPRASSVALAPLGALESRTSSATPTGLAQFALCPRLYFLDQLCGLAAWPGAAPEAPFTDGNAKEFGTAVHEHLAGEPSANPAVQELAAAFPRSELGQRAARAERVEREFDFVIAFGDLVVEGQIDLFFLEGGEAVVVDYKTDRSTERAAAYSIQLAVYREVVRRLHPGLPVRAFLYFLRSEQALEVSEELSAELLARYQSASTYPTQPGPHCDKCRHAGGACPVSSSLH